MSGGNAEITKKLLGGALKKLMAEKPLQEITVKELTEVSGVHRQTFYYHFQDIYDLLNWVFESGLSDVFNGEISSRSWQIKLRELLSYLEKNREVSICALKSLGRETLRLAMSDDLLAIVREVVLSYEISRFLDEKEIAFVTMFYLSALAGITERWLLGEVRLSTTEVVEMIENIAENQIAGALQRRGLLILDD